MNQSFYTGALGAGSSMAKLSVIANNLANINNSGFKPKNVAFSDLLNFNLNDSEDAVTELMAGNGVRLQRTYTTYNTSSFAVTNSDIDYAILQDNAFFMVQDPGTGEITYTRSGHFHRADMGEDGVFLMTDSGKFVLDENGERLEAKVIDLEPIRRQMEEGYGEEEYEDEELEEGEERPKLGLYTFSNPSRLMSVGDNEYIPPEGMEPILVENPKIQSGALENSGTDLASEMIKMIEAQRAYSYALKMVTTSDEIESTINSLRG